MSKSNVLELAKKLVAAIEKEDQKKQSDAERYSGWWEV